MAASMRYFLLYFVTSRKSVLLPLKHQFTILFGTYTKCVVPRYKNVIPSVQCRPFLSCNAVMCKNDSSNMSKQGYWEDFYHKKQLETTRTYDWFFPYEVAKPWLLHYITQQTAHISATSQMISKKHCILQVMDLGCGTSDLSTQLFVDNSTLQIHCVDFSAEAIKKMQTMFGHLQPQKECSPGVMFSQCDASRLPYDNHEFHICYEKGTIDAVLKQKTHGTSKAIDVICEVVRVIKLSGLFLQFSDEPPELRLPLLEIAKGEIQRSQNRNFSVSFKEISNFSGIEFFMYVMQDTRSISL